MLLNQSYTTLYFCVQLTNATRVGTTCVALMDYLSNPVLEAGCSGVSGIFSGLKRADATEAAWGKHPAELYAFFCQSIISHRQNRVCTWFWSGERIQTCWVCRKISHSSPIWTVTVIAMVIVEITFLYQRASVTQLQLFAINIFHHVLIHNIFYSIQ